MFKATLFACVIAAAGFGCKSDRTERETSYSNPVESSTYNTGAEATGRDTPSADTIRTDEAGHTVHDTQPAPAAGTDVQARPDGVNTRSEGVNMGYGTRWSGAGGAMREATEIDDDSDTSSIPNAGGTDQIRSGNGNLPADQPSTSPPSGTLEGDAATGAATPEASGTQPGQGAGANASSPTGTATGTDGDTTTTQPAPSGTSETATGTGTTNTGINTENAGQGGTDDPQR